MSFEHKSNGELHLHESNGTHFHIDSTVKQWAQIDATHIMILGNDGNLWYNEKQGAHWNVTPPPPGRFQIDGSVESFTVLDANSIHVRSSADKKLWLERGPWNSHLSGTKNRTEIKI